MPGSTAHTKRNGHDLTMGVTLFWFLMLYMFSGGLIFGFWHWSQSSPVCWIIGSVVTMVVFGLGYSPLWHDDNAPVVTTVLGAMLGAAGIAAGFLLMASHHERSAHERITGGLPAVIALTAQAGAEQDASWERSGRHEPIRSSNIRSLTDDGWTVTQTRAGDGTEWRMRISKHGWTSAAVTMTARDGRTWSRCRGAKAAGWSCDDFGLRRTDKPNG